jgi:hypothetical protein
MASETLTEIRERLLRAKTGRWSRMVLTLCQRANVNVVGQSPVSICPSHAFCSDFRQLMHNLSPHVSLSWVFQGTHMRHLPF